MHHLIPDKYCQGYHWSGIHCNIQAEFLGTGNQCEDKMATAVSWYWNSPHVLFSITCMSDYNLNWCWHVMNCILTHCSLVSGNTMWWQRSGSTLTQVMACCLAAPCHYPNQCWLTISEVLWHSPDDNFTGKAQYIYPWKEFETQNYSHISQEPMYLGTNHAQIKININSPYVSLKEVSFITSSKDHIDGLVQNCSISIVNTLEILQSCTKPSLCSEATLSSSLLLVSVYNHEAHPANFPTQSASIPLARLPWGGLITVMATYS